MNCCDEYGNCRQGRDCPARVAKVGDRYPGPEPLPRRSGFAKDLIASIFLALVAAIAAALVLPFFH